MKGTELFKAAIQNYLEYRAMTDDLFAPRYTNPAKNIDDCITYILNEVQKSGMNGFDDDEIYSMAMHYYDENDIEIGKPISCNVMVNHHVELTEEEKQNARKKAIEQYQQMELNKLQSRAKQKSSATQTIVTCTDCGHSWKGENIPSSDHAECTCPHCGSKLEVMKTRQRVFKGTEYFSIITTCKGYQVIRFFIVRANKKVGYQAKYEINEIVQQWIAPNGRGEIIARLRCMSSMYYDLWNEHSCMELRSNSNHFAYDITPQCTYPHIRIMKKIRRNGFKGKFYNISPNAFFKAILSDNKMETLLKVGQIEMFRHFIRSNAGINEYWAALKICIRNGYEITNASEWCDYIRLLKHFGMDIHNSKYVCPKDIVSEHDKFVKRRNDEIRQEDNERKKAQAIENERIYKEQKGKFFGISFTDGIIQVHVLSCVHDFIEEAEIMHHCVFSNSYYLKENSLILSATIEGKRIETIEVSLKTLKVVQSRGVCNKNTEYHEQIINLVNQNMGMIQKCLVA